MGKGTRSILGRRSCDKCDSSTFGSEEAICIVDALVRGASGWMIRGGWVVSRPDGARQEETAGRKLGNLACINACLIHPEKREKEPTMN